MPSKGSAAKHACDESGLDHSRPAPTRGERPGIAASGEPLVVGLLAGWLAGKIARGAGFGLIGDVAIGIVNAFIGDRLLPQIGIHLGTGNISAIVNATIGAVLLLLVVRLLQGGGRFEGGWGRRRWW
jgi:uncharacterized membrane protein YeaQ/YmgE (transglycosylase-associated protein family)